MSSTQSFIKSLINEHVCKVGGRTDPYFKTCHQATVIKTMWYWRRIDVERWNRIGNQEINPYVYGQLIFDRRAKTIQWEKNRLFNKWY